MDVTLGLVLAPSTSTEWPLTCLAVRCPHCPSALIVTRGKTRSGAQRYVYQNPMYTRGNCLRNDHNRGGLPVVQPTGMSRAIQVHDLA